MNPSDVLKEGDEVEAVVLSIDADKQRVSLGLKQIEPDPWVQVPEKYAIGKIVSGTVVNITSFGAFAKLEEGVEGLIHISELDERHVDNPEEVVSVGETLELKVISLDPEERRIGLSLKEAKTDNEESVVNNYMDGQHGSDRTTLADLMDNVPINRVKEDDTTTQDTDEESVSPEPEEEKVDTPAPEEDKEPNTSD